MPSSLFFLFLLCLYFFKEHLCNSLYLRQRGKENRTKQEREGERCFACVWNMNNVGDEHYVFFFINIHPPSFYTLRIAPLLMQHPARHSPPPLEIYWNVLFDKNLLCHAYHMKIQNSNEIYHVEVTRSNFEGSPSYSSCRYFYTLNIFEVENLFPQKMLWKINELFNKVLLSCLVQTMWRLGNWSVKSQKLRMLST